MKNTNSQSRTGGTGINQLTEILEALPTGGAFQGVTEHKTTNGSVFFRATWLSSLWVGFGWHDLLIMEQAAEKAGFRVNVVGADLIGAEQPVNRGQGNKTSFSISFYAIPARAGQANK